MKDWKGYLLAVVCIMCFAAISCQSMVDRVTPVGVDKHVRQYLESDKPSDVTSLYNAKVARADVIIKHRNEQTDLLRLAQDDEVAYKDAIGFIETSIEEAEYVQDIVIGSEEHPFSILGILAGMTGGLQIGRMLKRKGDYSQEELDVAVSKVNRE